MNLNDANLFSGVLGENQIKVNEPMSRHTTFGIGGPADFFLLPETTEELPNWSGRIICHSSSLAAVPIFLSGTRAYAVLSSARPVSRALKE